MSRWMFLALALGGLIGCQTSTGPVRTHTVVVTCPTSPPVTECPAFPILDEEVTVEELADAWIDGRRAHAECTAAVMEWQSSWASCASE